MVCYLQIVSIVETPKLDQETKTSRKCLGKHEEVTNELRRMQY